MKSISRLWLFVALLGLLAVAGGEAGRAKAAAALGPLPPVIYLPIVAKPLQQPSTGFLGMNGSPLDGDVTPYAAPVDGDLAYWPALRAKSFSWMNLAGLHWYRNYGSDGIVYSWRFVEPQKDTYDWAAWDVLVQEAQSHGVSLLASIGDSVPGWANQSSSWIDPPKDLYSTPMTSTSWYKYVYAFVDRYSGNGVNTMPGLTQPIKYWELWNEADVREGWQYVPNCGDPGHPPCPPHEFNGSVNDYVRLRQVGYAAIKAADPNAVVVGPTSAQFAGNTWRTDQWFIWTWGDFVAAGGMNTLDVVSFTHYFPDNIWDDPSFSNVTNNQWDKILPQIDSGRGGKPVWFTETGFNPPDTYSDAARSLVQSTVQLWALPWVQKYFWYDFHEGNFNTGYHRNLLGSATGTASRGVEPDPTFHPLYRTAELMSQILAGFDSQYHPATLDVGSAARAYHFSGSNGDVWVAWLRSASGSANISLDTGGRTTHLIGLYGQGLGTFSGGQLAVTPDPIYLTTDSSWNQNVDRITGRLHDKSQPGVWTNGVVSATVRLTGVVSATAQTDSDGNYVFSNLPDGNYHVSVPNCTANPLGYDLGLNRQADWGATSFTVTVPGGGRC